jgi:transcriptional repressor NrdR
MKCPFCHFPDSKVVDSRETGEGESIRRRRECLTCGMRFTTYEHVEIVGLMVVKKDGRRDPYDRDKILTGVRKACVKLPISMDEIDRIVDEIERELYRSGAREIPSSTIGEMVMQKLRDMDHVAYIRFASVYRRFSDLETMRQEMESLETPIKEA